MGWNPIRGITNAVRGVGRVVRGDFKKGLKDIAGGIPAALGAVALPGLGGVLGGALGKIGLGGVGKALGGIKLPGLGGLLDFAKNNPDLLLSGAQGVMGAIDSHKAGKMRSGALNRLGSAQRPDLSEAFADPGNVYARPVRLPKLGGGLS